MIASIWGENMLGYLSSDIICSAKLTVFLELRSWNTVRFSEQITSADKYPSIMIFLRQMGAIVYIFSVSFGSGISQFRKHHNILCLSTQNFVCLPRILIRHCVCFLLGPL